MKEIREELYKLTNQYYDIQEKIMNKIKELPFFGKECYCDDLERFSCEEDDNLILYCINCGGNIEW